MTTKNLEHAVNKLASAGDPQWGNALTEYAKLRALLVEAALLLNFAVQNGRPLPKTDDAVKRISEFLDSETLEKFLSV